MMSLVLDSEIVTKNSSHYKEGKVGTGDKGELMNFKGSMG
jgi:hypothetical protein